MIKEALQWLVELGQVETVEAMGRTYSTKQLHPLKFATPEPLKVNSLSAVTQYILSDFDKESWLSLMVHVVSPTEVALVSNLLGDGQRECYMVAKAMVNEYRFGHWYDIEQFIIALQAGFVRGDDREQILRVVGNIKQEAVRNYGDDGVSQSVTAKTGIATVDEVRVPNPVILAPFRTFVEVDQPESSFVFRMRQGQKGPECALFEADGGAWRLAAMALVQDQLEMDLADTGIMVIS